MRVEQSTDGALVRRVLIGMIVNKTVLARVTAKWEKGGLFAGKWENLIGSWCVSHFRAYNDAPGKAITDVLRVWAEDHPGETDIAKLVERFLGSLSAEYETLTEDVNADHVTDLAGRLFNRARLAKLRDDVAGHLAQGDEERAHLKVVGYRKVELGEGSVVDVFQDTQAMVEALTVAETKPLIEFPDALGGFFGRTLGRGGFVSVLAPEKTGKTFWLLEFAYRAVAQRQRVLYVDAGDMDQVQVLRRFAARVVGRPLRPGVVRRPVRLAREDHDQFATVEEFIERDYPEGLDPGTAVTELARFTRVRVKSHESYFKLSCHPNSTLGVAGVGGLLEAFAGEGWVADVVIIDYADILAPPPGVQETREKINENWKQLRALSQAHHCLVLTATQADAASYGRTLLGRENFSDDKRKNAHVTGMIGLNQTEEEKQTGIMRLNWIERREEAFYSRKVVHVAGCLALANPAMVSCF